MLHLRSRDLILLLTLQFGKSTFSQTPFKQSEFLLKLFCGNNAATAGWAKHPLWCCIIHPEKYKAHKR